MVGGTIGLDGEHLKILSGLRLDEAVLHVSGTLEPYVFYIEPGSILGQRCDER